MIKHLKQLRFSFKFAEIFDFQLHLADIVEMNKFILRIPKYAPIHSDYSAKAPRLIRLFKMSFFPQQLFKEHYFKSQSVCQANRNKIFKCLMKLKVYWQ
jgi:hypothetical protein